MTKRIAVDYENNAEEWWNAAKTDQNAPEAFAPLLADNADEVTVSDDEADEIIAWASGLPGWNDGPEYAPTALTVHEA
jgi:hypothetical protein